MSLLTKPESLCFSNVHIKLFNSRFDDVIDIMKDCFFVSTCQCGSRRSRMTWVRSSSTQPKPAEASNTKKQQKTTTSGQPGSPQPGSQLSDNYKPWWSWCETVKRKRATGHALTLKWSRSRHQREIVQNVHQETQGLMRQRSAPASIAKASVISKLAIPPAVHYYHCVLAAALCPLRCSGACLHGITI